MKQKLIFISFLLTLTACEHFGIKTRSEIREGEKKTEVVQKVTADLNNRMAESDAEIRALNGRIEVLENRIGQGNLDKEKSRKDTEIQISELTQKVSLLQEELTRIDNELALLKSLKVEAQASSRSSEGKPANAFEAGEENFNKKEWKKAILNYQKFRDASPKNKKIPEATYKIGVCFQELGMKEEAKTFFDDVISRFPNSNEAKKARSRLKRK